MKIEVTQAQAYAITNAESECSTETIGADCKPHKWFDERRFEDRLRLILSPTVVDKIKASRDDIEFVVKD